MKWTSRGLAVHVQDVKQVRVLRPVVGPIPDQLFNHSAESFNHSDLEVGYSFSCWSLIAPNVSREKVGV